MTRTLRRIPAPIVPAPKAAFEPFSALSKKFQGRSDSKTRPSSGWKSVANPNDEQGGDLDA